MIDHNGVVKHMSATSVVVGVAALVRDSGAIRATTRNRCRHGDQDSTKKPFLRAQQKC